MWRTFGINCNLFPIMSETSFRKCYKLSVKLALSVTSRWTCAPSRPETSARLTITYRVCIFLRQNNVSVKGDCSCNIVATKCALLEPCSQPRTIWMKIKLRHTTNKQQQHEESEKQGTQCGLTTDQHCRHIPFVVVVAVCNINSLWLPCCACVCPLRALSAHTWHTTPTDTHAIAVVDIVWNVDNNGSNSHKQHSHTNKNA